MTGSEAMHEVRQYRTALPVGRGSEPEVDLRQFPRHSHDQFGIGVIHSKCRSPWKAALAGSTPFAVTSSWSILERCTTEALSTESRAAGRCFSFFEPPIACEILADEPSIGARTLRPTVRDRDQATRFMRLFDAVTDPLPDTLHIDEELVRTLAYAFRNHSSDRSPRFSGLPCSQNREAD